MVVETGARLHFGFYSLLPLRRLWGGVGLGVDGVGYTIVLEEGDGVRVEGCQVARFHSFLREALDRLGLREYGVRLHAKRCIPEHRGLGSTTQAKLAVYAGLAALTGMEVDVYRLAELAGRGRVSGVGVAVFAYGGLVVDAGKRVGDEESVPRLMARVELPEEWRIVYMTPVTPWRVPEEGEVVYQGSVSMEEHCSILDTVFTWLLPSAVDRDFDSFTAAVEELERHMARYFSGAQGGSYCCREAEAAAEALKRAGGRGVGQSSWGPTIYAFFPGEREAREALNEAAGALEEKGIRLEHYGILKPRNRGASIRVEE